MLKPVMAKGSPEKEEFGGWRKPIVLRITKSGESRIICWINWNSRDLRYLRKLSRKHKGHRTSYIAQVQLLCSLWTGNSGLEHLKEEPLREQTTITINFHPQKSIFPMLESMKLRITPSNRNISKGYRMHCWCLVCISGTFKGLLFRKRLPDLG